jgi:hypothetical protein
MLSVTKLSVQGAASCQITTAPRAHITATTSHCSCSKLVVLLRGLGSHLRGLALGSSRGGFRLLVSLPTRVLCASQNIEDVAELLLCGFDRTINHIPNLGEETVHSFFGDNVTDASLIWGE